MSSPRPEFSEDRLLDGQVRLRQPVEGYRAGMDAVLLAAALDAKPGEHLVEFGCGAGAGPVVRGLAHAGRASDRV